MTANERLLNCVGSGFILNYHTFFSSFLSCIALLYQAWIVYSYVKLKLKHVAVSPSKAERRGRRLVSFVTDSSSNVFSIIMVIYRKIIFFWLVFDERT